MEYHACLASAHPCRFRIPLRSVMGCCHLVTADVQWQYDTDFAARIDKTKVLWEYNRLFIIYLSDCKKLALRGQFGACSSSSRRCEKKVGRSNRTEMVNNPPQYHA